MRGRTDSFMTFLETVRQSSSARSSLPLIDNRVFSLLLASDSVSLAELIPAFAAEEISELLDCVDRLQRLGIITASDQGQGNVFTLTKTGRDVAQKAVPVAR